MADPVRRINSTGRWMIGIAVIALAIIALFAIAPTKFGVSW